MKNRVGEKYITNDGFEIEIIEYFNSRNCTVKFEDGDIREKLWYSNVSKGAVRKFIKRVGQKFTTNEGYEVEIIAYRNPMDLDIMFTYNGFIIRNRCINSVRNGKVRNPFHLSVHRVGFIGVNPIIPPSENGIVNKCYMYWNTMMDRCYFKKYQETHLTYKDVIVCEEWKCYANFCTWFKDNYNSETMKSWQLDKDILVKGNKVYSPETCCFVPSAINSLFKTKIKEDGLPNGVFTNKGSINKPYRTSLNQKRLGNFTTVEEAFQAYKTAKEMYIKEVADKWKDLIDDRVYKIMYNYELDKNGL